MVALGCGGSSDCLGCSDAPRVKLWDGRLVCSACDDWRTECEARRLLKIRSMKKIAVELEWRESLHGRDTTKLKRYMRGIWEQKKGKR